jgi:type VI secretion system protein ImpL
MWSQLSSTLGISALLSVGAVMSAAVWGFGPWVGLGPFGRIVLIACVLLTLPIVFLVARSRAKREKAAPETSEPKALKKKGGAELEAPVGENAELTRGAEEVVQWLRKTKLGADRSVDAVYSLPWFLFAGPPEAGKTSLLLGSALDFHALPSQRSGEREALRPTQGCEWRVTDTAVLLDTAGRYQTEGPDREEWSSLLETARKYRADRPLDGYVIAVSAAKVLAATDAEIEQEAKVVRARLDEAATRARARFPVYLVFTHADAIEGFDDFFAQLDGSERAQVWGATIPLEQSADAYALFDVEFDYLLEAVNRRRLVRLGSTDEPDEQLRIFEFPERLAEARRRLGLYISSVFKPNPFSESPLLRGFYLTSSPPSGSSFTENLLHDVLLRDKDIAAAFQSAKPRPKHLRHAAVAAAAALLLFLTVGMIVSFARNKTLVAEAVERGTEVNRISLSDKGKDPTKKSPEAARTEIDAADALRETIAGLDEYDRESPPLWLRFGFYKGGALFEPLRIIYFDSIQQRFLNGTFSALRRDLEQFATGPALAPGAAAPSAAAPGAAAPSAAAPGAAAPDLEALGERYDLLKAYLMLSGSTSQVEPSFLRNELAPYWKTLAPASLEYQAINQLDFYTRQVERGDMGLAPPLGKATLDAARQRLAAYPPYLRYYKRVVTGVPDDVREVTLAGIVQDRGGGWLETSEIIPAGFTKAAYREHVLAAIDNAAVDMRKDDFVMGDASKGGDTVADTRRLQEKYFQDYIKQWQRFIGGIRVRPIKNAAEAAATLNALSEIDSPLVLVLQSAAEHTNLSGDPPSGGIIGWFKSFFADKGPTIGDTLVEKQFAPLIKFASGKSKEDDPLSQYRRALENVASALEGKNEEQLKQTAQALVAGKEDDNIGLRKAEGEVARLASSFKDTDANVAAALLRQPLSRVREWLTGGGSDEISRIWAEEILPNAKKLESDFPFKEGAGNSAGVPINDLTKFLNPVNGQLSTLYSGQLASSFEGVPGQLRLKESAPIKFSSEFVAYLNAALQLREDLFPAGSPEPKLGYTLTLEPTPGAEVVVDIDGRSASTGTPQLTNVWPPGPGGSGAKISVFPSEAIDGPPTPQTWSGPWALFKMFLAGSPPGETGGNQYPLSWSVKGGTVRAKLQPSSSANPFGNRLKHFRDLRAPQTIQE